LDAMQNSYNIFQAFGDLVGEKSIVKGCKTTGTTVSDGVIYLNGELIEFRGGQLQTTIVVIEEVTNGEFEDGFVKPIYYTRYATFGSGLNQVNWSDFVRAYPLTSALFVDEVRMYSGLVADIPFGWYLMDGTNGTLDIRDKFPVPYNPATADYNAIGKTGGAKEVTLSKSQLPNYNLGATLHTTEKTVTGKYVGKAGDGWPKASGDRTTVGSINSYVRWSEQLVLPALDIEATIASGGGDQAHENRPPFVALGFIQFKGI